MNTIKEAHEIDVFYKLWLDVVSDFTLRATSWSKVLLKLHEAQLEPTFGLLQDSLTSDEIN